MQSIIFTMQEEEEDEDYYPCNLHYSIHNMLYTLCTLYYILYTMH